MMEFENIYEALTVLKQLGEATSIQVNGKPATIEDLQEDIRDVVYQVEGFLGVEVKYESD